MRNPIKPVGLFATPDSMEAFQKYLALFTGSEGIAAQTAAWMAWNLASKIMDNHLSAFDTFDQDEEEAG